MKPVAVDVAAMFPQEEEEKRPRPVVPAEDWPIYRHTDPAEPLPRCAYCPFLIADGDRVTMVRSLETADGLPAIVHSGCAFDRRRTRRVV